MNKILCLLLLLVALLTAFCCGAKVRRNVLYIPLDSVPGYTFMIDSITYQVRPIKAQRVLYWDGQADSVYKKYMEIIELPLTK